MLSRTHDLFAFESLVVAAIYFPLEQISLVTVLVVVVANIVGALLPDIDQASNRLWDLLPGGDFIGEVVKDLFLSHRTISHSALGVVLVYQLINWLIPIIFNPNFVDSGYVVAAVMIGYGSHLILDSLTEEGLPLLFPLKVKFGIPPIRSWRIKTGKWFENWVVFPSIAITTIWFLSQNWKSLIGLVKW